MAILSLYLKPILCDEKTGDATIVDRPQSNDLKNLKHFQTLSYTTHNKKISSLFVCLLAK